ncbi:hypothetical protein AWENTII_012307 [Aspergillus wentii]
MAFPGQRFVVDFDDDEIDVNKTPVDDSPLPSISLIGEIRERAPSAAVPPAPKPPSGTGFPQHRRRVNQSSFKQRRAQKQQEAEASTASASASTSATPTLNDDKKSIDEQNRRQIESMSASQLQQERDELMSTMDSSLLERFLRRAKIDDDEKAKEPTPEEPPRDDQKDRKTQKKSVSFDVPEPSPPSTKPPANPPSQSSAPPVPPPVNEDLPPSHVPDDLHPAAELPPPNSVHFPTPPPHQQNPLPNLDPFSPSFLSDLQAHYFPEMSHDPSALSWLKPPSSSSEDPDSSSAYHPASSADAVHPSAIRFSLIGTLLSPSTSLSLPTNLGLHHHGEDPQAAGYTIPELAILSRSSFPAQRCIAWQVLGRILFRLGKGQFGERGSTLVEGLWFVIEREGVVGRMLAEADGNQSSGPRRTADKDKNDSAPSQTMAGGVGRHASASAWAVEGVWLWQMGGAGDRGVLKEGAVRPQ